MGAAIWSTPIDQMLAFPAEKLRRLLRQSPAAAPRLPGLAHGRRRQPPVLFPHAAAGREVTVRILKTDGDGPILAATFGGRRRDLTTAELLAALYCGCRS
jgi:hypothetical protein